MPVLDDHDERPTTGQRANERRQRVEQRRLEVFTAEVPWEDVDIAAHGQQVQEERQERLEPWVDRANPRRDIRARQRRPEVESRAQDLHEDAVGNAVAVRPASRMQHAHAARLRCADAPAARRAVGSFPAPASPTTATTAPMPLWARATCD